MDSDDEERPRRKGSLRDTDQESDWSGQGDWSVYGAESVVAWMKVRVQSVARLKPGAGVLLQITIFNMSVIGLRR